jgi:hypothetical protein
MKSNREWFNLLTDKEQEQFKRNCVEHSFHLSWKRYKKEFSEDFYKFVTSAFTWYETDEGHDYWSEIAKSNRTIKD